MSTNNIVAFTNVLVLRNRIRSLDRKNGNAGPDEYREQARRQNSGGFCSKCGSTSGHYHFCTLITGR
jgi:hypothetical protein